MMRNQTLEAFMIRDVRFVYQDEKLSAVEEKMRLNRIRHLPIVNDDKKVVGVITERDLFRVFSPRKTDEGYYFEPEELDQFILKYVMTQNVIVLHPEDTLEKAIPIFVYEKIGCIPIVNARGILVGIITPKDVLKFLSDHL